MTSRAVERLVTLQQQVEGGGFLVRKVLGSNLLRHLDPFVMLDHIGPAEYGPGEAVGAPDHPHRGFEVVTYVIEGGVDHKDSAGHNGILGPGWVQWMTAGRGVIHCEMPTEEMVKNGCKVEAFQLWVNLPSKHKMDEPRYQDTAPEKLPVIKSDDGSAEIKIIAGSVNGVRSPIETKTPILYLDMKLNAGATYTLPLPRSYRGLVYCWKGEGMAGSADAPLSFGQVGVLSASEHGDCIRLKASSSSSCNFLLVCGEPIGEPIVQYGPFVMNTVEEIEQAINDFKNGVLGEIPGADERYRQTEEAMSRKK